MGVTTPSRWTAAHISAAPRFHGPELAEFESEIARPLDPNLNLWDIWPVQTDDGALAQTAIGTLWVMLSAPRSHDPDARHNQARMRLILRQHGRWIDCGDLLPDGFSPGSREWSGSTRLDTATGDVTLWFTATGRRGDSAETFEQRLFHAVGRLDLSNALPKVIDWRDLTQSVTHGGELYADLTVNQGEPGRIKGMRDPYWFRDPADGQGYILFTGSKSAQASQSPYDGVIGLARAQDQVGQAPFFLEPPLIDADGLANELERPHVFVQDGLYYLFWCTQRSVFAPTGPSGPTGLYGMVGESLRGPYRPMNGSGLVLANPSEEPQQAYAWQVLPSLEVVSFVDYWGVKGRDLSTNLALKAAQFGGTIAPIIKIALDGATSRIVEGGR